MSQVGHSLTLNMEHVNSEANHTLDNLGIAKNAREEKMRAREDKPEGRSRERADGPLYREDVLDEKPVEEETGFRLDATGPASNNAAFADQQAPETEPVAGD